MLQLEELTVDMTNEIPPVVRLFGDQRMLRNPVREITEIEKLSLK
jgi:hypothetical protein